MTASVATVFAVFFTPIVYVAVFCAELVPKSPEVERDEEDRNDELVEEYPLPNEEDDELLEPACATIRGVLLDVDAAPVEYPSP